MRVPISHCKLSKKVQKQLLQFFVAEVTARTASDGGDKPSDWDAVLPENKRGHLRSFKAGRSGIF